MLIERKIKLNNIDYFLGFKLKYDKSRKLVKMDKSYFDLGDLSIMIEFFEKSYNNAEKYENCIGYMNDIIYLFDRFPFLEYIKDVSYDKEGKMNQVGYIKNKEIRTYIKNMKITINKWDKNNCLCPMLYK